MILDDQSEVTDFLRSQPCGPGREGETVREIETHISRIFLAGDRAFKLKRAVRLPYADFSTPQIRLETCEKEFALNRPTAPGIYLGVRRITRQAGGLAFDGDGPLVDAVVEMTRFAQDDILDRVAAAGALTEAHAESLARTVAAMHARAPVVRRPGGGALMEGVLDINRAGFATSRVFAPEKVAALDEAFRRAFRRHRGQLDRRGARGLVRLCHGDLHLANIVLHEGRPEVFDAIDFNDGLATVDVAYDLAFLLMDLWHRGLPDLANRVANRYFDTAGAEDAQGLLPFLMAVRAEVRAHVTATAATDDPDRAAMAQGYFDLACDLLAPEPGRVVVLGGLSGSGKTTLAERIAPHLGPAPGARIVESDRTRKAMFGVEATEHLPQEAYAPGVSDDVYARIAARARALAEGGATVVVGAVFDSAAHRAELDRRLAGLRVDAVWLEAAPDRLRDRIATRGASASDATLDVLETQLSHGPGRIGWPRIDVNGTLEATLARLCARLS
ncbi:aminoglycoside phosphotransferase [Rhodovulum sp. BSW8]|uniref:bifunctional aminoglycoside phosphotransferase/ATP-binding protein n=1 Tax=Rhodovulum sp. BSW8 TaxID=2259645 RepID=UPI000DE4F7C1|nr:AAA family ATPase [Rhodovulum sp. BSW8]RBO51758.1 aminoglycoside phosphotransferase [Rhodovulum sp. BSW8]